MRTPELVAAARARARTETEGPDEADAHEGVAVITATMERMLRGEDARSLQAFCSSLNHDSLAAPTDTLRAALVGMRVISASDAVSPVVHNAAMLSSLTRACVRLCDLEDTEWLVRHCAARAPADRICHRRRRSSS